MQNAHDEQPDRERLNAESRAMWEAKAAFWDALFGDAGNVFHRRLVEPAILQLLNLSAGEAVLDLGCGNGVVARRLAKLGARVTAIDFSREMLRLARERSAGLTIDYRLMDASDETALLGLGRSRFDAVVSSMALMDMADIEPLFRAARQLLRAKGRFVFATMHPCFNSNNPVFLREKEDRDGVVSEHFAVKIRHYLGVPPVLGSGAPGEPAPHYYFHRPLGELLGVAFASGFALDGLLERAFRAEDARDELGLSWQNFPQIPPVIACRLRPI